MYIFVFQTECLFRQVTIINLSNKDRKICEKQEISQRISQI